MYKYIGRGMINFYRRIIESIYKKLKAPVESITDEKEKWIIHDIRKKYYLTVVKLKHFLDKVVQKLSAKDIIDITEKLIKSCIIYVLGNKYSHTAIEILSKKFNIDNDEYFTNKFNEILKFIKTSSKEKIQKELYDVIKDTSKCPTISGEGFFGRVYIPNVSKTSKLNIKNKQIEFPIVIKETKRPQI